MVAARKYNPGFLTDDELVESFCVRTNEFDSIIEVLRECTGRSNPHQLLIGPRGCGKTTLLLRVAVEVRRDAELSSGFFPIVFAEESYEVATTGEFWLECLSRLAVQAPKREGEPDLNLSYEELRTVHDDRTLAERCLGALLDFSDREDKRLVLVVENLNMMFKGMMDRDAGWRLRKILQTEPRIVLLASATSRFDEIDNPEQALYDLFRVSTLRPLDTNECAVLWQTVSGKCRPPGTIRYLEILTGGSPRLLAIVARFGAELSFRELMADLLDLVDEHTEYFKSHIEALPAQERRVYLALANLWKPATTREIADRARLDTSKCSAQLKRLVERGTAKVAGGTARRKQYYLSERMYNIYYLLRRSRGPDGMVEALIYFMEWFYSPPEQIDIFARLAREVDSFSARMESIREIVLARMIEMPALAEHREELLAAFPKNIAGTPDHAVASTGMENIPSDDAHSLHGKTNSKPLDTSKFTDLQAARNLVHTTVKLSNRNKLPDALRVCNELISRFAESNEAAVLELVAETFVNKGILLNSLGRPEEALTACEDSARQFGTNDSPVMAGHAAWASFLRGDTLISLRRPEEALRAFDDLIHRFGESDDPAVLESVAMTLARKESLLNDLDRPDEALVAGEELVNRFATRKTSILPAYSAKSMFLRGGMLSKLNRSEDALCAYDELIRSFGENDEPENIEFVAKALVNKGEELARMDRLEEALDAFCEILNRFGTLNVPAVVDSVAMALVNRGIALRDLNRPEQALDACKEVVSHFETSESPAMLARVALALNCAGDTLSSLDRYEDAIASYDEVVSRFSTYDDPAILEQVSIALYNKGHALGKLERPEQALVVYDEVVNRFGRNDIHAMQIAKALINKGISLAELNRPREALATCDEIARRFGTSELPEVMELVATALFNKGVTLGKLGDIGDALVAYTDLVGRFDGIELSSVRTITERALLEMANIETGCFRHEAAIEKVIEVLDRRGAKSRATRCQGHLIRANAALAIGDVPSCEKDIESCLAIFPELGVPPKRYLDALMGFCIKLGENRMRDIIQASPAAALLRPVTTALELELGLEPRVAVEVMEVAQDIRRHLAKLARGEPGSVGDIQLTSPALASSEQRGD